MRKFKPFLTRSQYILAYDLLRNCMTIFIFLSRHWQELGYLILYITARPDMQQKKVVAWLAQHNFPHGLVSFMDGMSYDPLRQKANFLKGLVNEAKIQVKRRNYVLQYQSFRNDFKNLCPDIFYFTLFWFNIILLSIFVLTVVVKHE